MRAKSDATPRTSSRPDEELPELTDEMLGRAVLKRGGKRVGRPPSPDPKVAISLRLDRAILARWKATGPGWQTRMAEALGQAARSTKTRPRSTAPRSRA